MFEELLKDQTSKSYILWATDDYSYLGDAYGARAPITPEAVTENSQEIISPRVLKTPDRRNSRTKRKAEVFTPSWLCNYQNSVVDDAWFERTGVFNTPKIGGWCTNNNRIRFNEKGAKTWKSYVDEPRLEITCGEAPYLVSRYDATTGDFIATQDRIGLLDRKLRVVTENTSGDDQWTEWAERAFQSVYGYEFHGDSLLLARENLLATYIDYSLDALHRMPSTPDLERIASIISWNLWQMDAFTGTIPYLAPLPPSSQDELFDLPIENVGRPCVIMDWRAKETVTYLELTTEG